jgi:hypothetical protein
MQLKNNEVYQADLLRQHGLFRAVGPTAQSCQEEKGEETGNQEGIARG